jgi:hypothetical protein
MVPSRSNMAMGIAADGISAVLPRFATISPRE